MNKILNMEEKELKKGYIYMENRGNSFIYEGEEEGRIIGTPLKGVYEIRRGKCSISKYTELKRPEEFIGEKINSMVKELMDVLMDVIEIYGGSFTFETSDNKKKVSVYDKERKILEVEELISGGKHYIRETNMLLINELLDEIRCYGGLKNEELGRY